MVLDSLPTALDTDGTLLQYSPSDLLNTDVAKATLQSVDEHDRRMEEEALEKSKVGVGSLFLYSPFHYAN